MPVADVAVSGIIPGLFVYEEFVTREEEKAMIKKIDSGKWIKLLKRRVQHFGFEFKYGANNVDTED